MKTTSINFQNPTSSTKKLVQTGSKKILLFSLLFLSFTFSAFSKSTSSENIKREKEITAIREQLFAKIQFPAFMKESNLAEESVNVFFQVQKDGSIKVIRTDAKNEQLNQFILLELQNAKLDSLEVSEDNVYKINIHFKLL
jgi:hypothetical protein